MLLTTILVLMVIAAVLLIIVILIQNPKGGGLSGEFGGATSQMFGVQRSGDIMEKLTWGFFAFIIVGTLTTGIIFSNASGTAKTNAATDVEQAQTAPATLPATPGATLPAATTPATSTDSTK
ncbi:MAG: preprotein translocase subunit SecG [Spirosomataceae bacterium]